MRRRLTPRRSTHPGRTRKAFRDRDQPLGGGSHGQLRPYVVVGREAHRRQSLLVPQEVVGEQRQVLERPAHEVLAGDEGRAVRGVLGDEHAPVRDPLEHAHPLEVRALLTVQVQEDLRRAQALPLRLAEEKVRALARLRRLRRDQQSRAVRPEGSREARERA